MAIYIALLRGINVGGHNLVKMSELKQIFDDMGFKKVKTYIQSGNVLFESDEDASILKGKIEQQLHSVVGKPVSVALRTSEEMKRVITNCPFKVDSLAEGDSIHVSLLTEPPSQEGIDKLTACDKGVDDYHIEGNDVYLLLRQSIRDSKLAVHLSKLGVPATARNWNTVNKLCDLAKSLED